MAKTYASVTLPDGTVINPKSQAEAIQAKRKLASAKRESEGRISIADQRGGPTKTPSIPTDPSKVQKVGEQYDFSSLGKNVFSTEDPRSIEQFQKIVPSAANSPTFGADKREAVVQKTFSDYEARMKRKKESIDAQKKSLIDKFLSSGGTGKAGNESYPQSSDPEIAKLQNEAMLLRLSNNHGPATEIENRIRAMAEDRLKGSDEFKGFQTEYDKIESELSAERGRLPGIVLKERQAGTEAVGKKDTEELGKERGSEIQQGKITNPAFANLSEEERQAVTQIYDAELGRFVPRDNPLIPQYIDKPSDKGQIGSAVLPRPTNLKEQKAFDEKRREEKDTSREARIARDKERRGEINPDIRREIQKAVAANKKAIETRGQLESSRPESITPQEWNILSNEEKTARIEMDEQFQQNKKDFDDARKEIADSYSPDPYTGKLTPQDESAMNRQLKDFDDRRNEQLKSEKNALLQFDVMSDARLGKEFGPGAEKNVLRSKQSALFMEENNGFEAELKQKKKIAKIEAEQETEEFETEGAVSQFMSKFEEEWSKTENKLRVKHAESQNAEQEQLEIAIANNKDLGALEKALTSTNTLEKQKAKEKQNFVMDFMAQDTGSPSTVIGRAMNAYEDSIKYGGTAKDAQIYADIDEMIGEARQASAEAGEDFDNSTVFQTAITRLDGNVSKSETYMKSRGYLASDITEQKEGYQRDVLGYSEESIKADKDDLAIGDIMKKVVAGENLSAGEKKFLDEFESKPANEKQALWWKLKALDPERDNADISAEVESTFEEKKEETFSRLAGRVKMERVQELVDMGFDEQTAYQQTVEEFKSKEASAGISKDDKELADFFFKEYPDLTVQDIIDGKIYDTDIKVPSGTKIEAYLRGKVFKKMDEDMKIKPKTSFWEYLDKAFGGWLPGGITREEAKQDKGVKKKVNNQPTSDIVEAIGFAESFNAKNADTIEGVELTKGAFKGQKAFGKFQIMPSNFEKWKLEAGLEDNATPTPENQEKVASYKLNEFLEWGRRIEDDEKDAIRLASVRWYGNNGEKLTSVEDISTKPVEQGGKRFKSPKQYADNIVKIIGTANAKKAGYTDEEINNLLNKT